MSTKVDIPMGMKIKEVNKLTGEVTFEPIQSEDIDINEFDYFDRFNTFRDLIILSDYFKSNYDTEENGTYFSIVRQTYGIEVAQFSFKFNHFTFNSKEIADKFLSLYKDKFKSCHIL